MGHRGPPGSYNHEKTSSSASYSQSYNQMYGPPPNGRYWPNPYPTPFPFDDDDAVSPSSYGRVYRPNQPQQQQNSYGTGFDEGDDDFDEHSQASYPTSGRGTPMGGRRSTAQSMPPERDQIPGYDRPRAHTEDTNGPVMAQWRGMPPPPPPPSTGLPPPPSGHRPMGPPRVPSDASFGPGVVPPRNRPPLRSQFSTTKLSSVYSGSESGRSVTPSLPAQPQPTHRSRSASQPSAYVSVPKSVPPPLPTGAPWTRQNGDKRGSGSSQSTGDSSDYSPNSSSPITPFGSSESSLGALGLRPSRSQTFDNVMMNDKQSQLPTVKVKVHFGEDIFIIQVPRQTEYHDLVDKVGKKIALCGRRRDDGPLRVKYRDEDGDLISLGSTEDAQMAFEQIGPNGQVALFVT